MADLFFLTLSALLTGFFIGWALFHPSKEKLEQPKRVSLTRLLFGLLTGCALLWVFWSFALATYATVALGQVYTLSELADPAINGLLGVVALKVTENIFEHNDGGLFGRNNGKDE